MSAKRVNGNKDKIKSTALMETIAFFISVVTSLM